MQDRRVELAVELPRDSVLVDGDEARLAQVLGNLLNAAKFTPGGGRVTLAVTAEGEQAVIRVRDTGAGVAPAMLESIFEPFTQAKQTLARSEGGRRSRTTRSSGSGRPWSRCRTWCSATSACPGWTDTSSRGGFAPSRPGAAPGSSRSAGTQPEDVAKSIEAGFDAHVAKPPDPEKIADLLDDGPGGPTGGPRRR